MIELSHLSKTYRTGFFRKATPGVHDVNLTIQENNIVGFVGPNGSGKTTTLKLLLGLLKPTSGEVKILGKPPSDHNVRSQVGFLPELPYTYDFLTGSEYLEFYGKLSGMAKSEITHRAGELAKVLNLDARWLHKRVRQYSKGMVQKLGLIQAVLHKPKIVILDEPMSGLDPGGRVDVRNLIQHLKSQGSTIFYSSHVLSDVELICDEVAIIVNGTIRKSGSKDDLLATGTLEEIFTREVKAAKV